MPVPEPELNLPAPDESNTKPGSENANTDTHPSVSQPHAEDKPDRSADKSGIVRSADHSLSQKVLDATDAYQPDDLNEQLAALTAQGVTHVMWLANSSSCLVCLQNDGITVDLGQPFPSGHILPQAHPHCDCRVVSMQFSKPKSVEDALARKQKRQEYREFMEAVL